MLMVDAHEDLAWNMLTYGRDYTLSSAETRRLEASGDAPSRNDDSLLGWPDYYRGRMAVTIASLFAEPARAVLDLRATQVYSEPRQANRLAHQQMDAYERMADNHPDHFRLIRSRADLEQVVDAWKKVDEKDSPPAESAGPAVGLVVSMEGAEAILEPGEVEAWWERGVRLIGLAWRSTPYSGGTYEPGPLTRMGFELLERMAELNAGLDLTHMDDTAARQALDAYPGPLLASHSNAQALIKDGSNRHLPDDVIAGIIERDGVIGIVPYIEFLRAGWKRGDRRDEGSLAQVAAQIDYVCQIAGDARHVGFGTDFDGGFGLQSVPPGIDSIADLHKLAPLLSEKGYTEGDLTAIFGGNWLNLLSRILP